jgi:F-type H+-transporting ATPase subunit delta
MAKTIDRQLAKALYQLVESATKADLDRVLTNFVVYLKTIGALSRWSIIVELYRHYWQKEQGIIEAEIVSARPLNKKQLAMLANELTIITAAKQVVLIEKINPEILGGFIIKLPDRLLDASYQRQVRNLQAKLLY